MFIIWGFGHTTTKNYGFTSAVNCGRCNNSEPRTALKVTTWFTLFFIPVIPYNTQYLLVCPICGQAEELTKEEFSDLIATVQSGDATYQTQPHSDRQLLNKNYAGKTPTQIAYLSQLEEARLRREQHSN